CARASSAESQQRRVARQELSARSGSPAFPPGSSTDTLADGRHGERMMHILLRVLVGTAALLAVTAPALAAGQVGWDDCKGDDPGRSIAACTRIIQGRGETAQRLANAHYNRGVAYKDKGALDRAIADFTEAIRLNPRHVMALGNRGAAYSAKDDN